MTLNTDLLLTPSAWLDAFHAMAAEYMPHRVDKGGALSTPQYKGGALSTPQYSCGFDDIYAYLTVAAVLTVLRLIIISVVFKPMGRAFFGVTKHRKLQKFGEAGWFFIYYFTMLTYAVTQVILSEQDSWVYTRLDWWAGYPNTVASLPLKVYFVVGTSFYIHAMFVVFVEEKRKDFKEMVTHHISTVILTVGAGLTFQYRVSFVILCLHDVADVFLYGGKLFVYGKFELISNIILGSMAVMFFLTRLVFLPIVIYSTIMERRMTRAAEGVAPEFSTDFLATFLVVLLGLHVFWFSLIARMVWRALASKNVEKDIRSDSDDD